MKIFYSILIAAVVTLASLSARATKASEPSCQIVSEGIYRGAWVKHRIMLYEQVVFGTNDMDSLLSQLEYLREVGVCN